VHQIQIHAAAFRDSTAPILCRFAMSSEVWLGVKAAAIAAIVTIRLLLKIVVGRS
jgi:hypothetical protein